MYGPVTYIPDLVTYFSHINIDEISCHRMESLLHNLVRCPKPVRQTPTLSLSPNGLYVEAPLKENDFLIPILRHIVYI